VRVLGIDPGTRVVGGGVVERSGHRLTGVACGVLKAAAAKPVPERLRIMHEGIRALVREHRPDLVAVEEAFFGVGARAALALGEARGAALLAAEIEGVAIVQFPPATVKKAVTGRGAAEKPQVARMVQIVLGLAAIPEPADAADALAVAICAAQRATLPRAT
jgi:crossover junction endodeoxyribonuclease RuvC